MGVAILVSEILLLSKMVKFPFPTMDYSPWSSKNLIIWNRLNKFMQVEVNVLCMHTNFDGCRHSGFGDIATFKNGQIREIWPFLKGSHISETGGATPTKTGMHARDVNPSLHTFFELIPIDEIFPLL